MKTPIIVETRNVHYHNVQLCNLLIELSAKLKTIFKDCGSKCTYRNDCQYESRLIFCNSGIYLQEKKAKKSFDLSEDKLYFVQSFDDAKKTAFWDDRNITLDKIHIIAKIIEKLQSTSNYLQLKVNASMNFELNGTDLYGNEFIYEFKTLKVAEANNQVVMSEYYQYKQMRLH